MDRFLLAAAALLLAAVAGAPPAGALQLPQLEEKDLPPSLVWDAFRYGKRPGDRIDRVVSPIKGLPPVVVNIPDQEDFTSTGRYKVHWLDHYFFDHKLLPMNVLSDRNGHRNGAEHVAAVAAGIGEIVRRAPRLGYDADRIVLVGNGWGAQVAALLATDPAWLGAEGVPLSSIRAVFVLDGFGLDLEGELQSADSRRRKEIGKMLGGEAPTRLSPLRHAAAPNAARFLFYAPPDAPESLARAKALAAALRSAGTVAEVKRVARTRSDIWTSYPGHPRHSETDALARFVREAVSRP
jgi:pimeloyl-ACP methyl ester carboxylesterase